MRAYNYPVGKMRGCFAKLSKIIVLLFNTLITMCSFIAEKLEIRIL